MLITPAYAQDTTAVSVTPPATDPTVADPQNALLFNIGFIILLFVMFYFLMIRPQQKRMKEQQNLIDALSKGDRVITNGGIIGTITKAPANGEVEIEIAEGVKVTVLRYSVYKKYDPSEFADKTTDKKSA